jgi:integrase
MDDYRVNGKRSLDDLRARFNLHILPFFEGIRASALTTPRIREYIAHRQAGEASNGTINRELGCIRRAFRLGMIDGRIQYAPHIPMLRESAPRIGFFTPEQFRALRDALPDYLRGFVSFGYLTGWRKGEVSGLLWRNIQETEIRLDPGTTKSGAGRVFPIDRDLGAVLDVQRSRRKKLNPYVFTTDKGQPIREFRKTWAAACKQAGIPVTIEPVRDEKGRIRYKRIIPSLTFHDFRRTAYRRLVREGTPERVAMDLVGWRSRATADRYNVVSVTDLREAVERVRGRL